MEQEIYRRIVINPSVMVGKPVVKGTRIPVDTIIRLLAQGMTPQEILEDYPNLAMEDIRAALEYVADIVKGEDIYLLPDKEKE